MARRVVAHGYASTMSRIMMQRLARHDPAFPHSLTVGEENQEKLWSWTEVEPYWQARAYPPSAWVAAGRRIAPSQPDAVAAAVEVVTPEVAAQRLVDHGYVAAASRRQLVELARRNPSFPASLPTSSQRPVARQSWRRRAPAGGAAGRLLGAVPGPFVWLISASLRPRAYVFDTSLLPLPFSSRTTSPSGSGPPSSPG
jgi:hypothetical protein